MALWFSVAYAVSIGVRVLAESHPPEWVAGQIADYPGLLLTLAAWITAVFAVLEYLSTHYPEKCPDFMAMGKRWSPTSLPPLEKEPPAGSKPRNLATAAAEFVVQFALLIWMLLLPSYPFLLLGPGAAYLEHWPLRPTQICLVFSGSWWG